MAFRKFKQNKLWRDKAVASMQGFGGKIHWTHLNDQEFLVQLKAKLLEEAHEVCHTTTKATLIEELADVLEVIDALCKAHELTLQDVFDAKEKKYLVRGGFNDRVFVSIAEYPTNSFGEAYCLADPEKYPEIID